MTEQMVMLHDPHPSHLGAILPISLMKNIVASLNGEVISLTQAIDICKSVARVYKGNIKDMGEWIGFRFIENNREHMYRLIRYKEVEK